MEYCDKRALTSILSYRMWAIFQGMEAKENQQITIVFWLAKPFEWWYITIV
jgi:hypothetical protein